MTTDDEILKGLEEKARKKGWIAGKHIFHFLDETDMMIWSNTREKIAVEKAIAISSPLPNNL
ncbi:MAG: hypothetical protein AAB355_00265 [Patescibacteria group bacterium]